MHTILSVSLRRSAPAGVRVILLILGVAFAGAVRGGVPPSAPEDVPPRTVRGYFPACLVGFSRGAPPGVLIRVKRVEQLEGAENSAFAEFSFRRPQADGQGVWEPFRRVRIPWQRVPAWHDEDITFLPQKTRADGVPGPDAPGNSMKAGAQICAALGHFFVRTGRIPDIFEVRWEDEGETGTLVSLSDEDPPPGLYSNNYVFGFDIFGVDAMQFVPAP